jgi:hypothetical protein
LRNLDFEVRVKEYELRFFTSFRMTGELSLLFCDESMPHKLDIKLLFIVHCTLFTDCYNPVTIKVITRLYFDKNMYTE